MENIRGSIGNGTMKSVREKMQDCLNARDSIWENNEMEIDIWNHIWNKIGKNICIDIANSLYEKY